MALLEEKADRWYKSLYWIPFMASSLTTLRQRLLHLTLSAMLTVSLFPPRLPARDNAEALVAKVWARYRSVATEVEWADILVIDNPQQLHFTTIDAERFLRQTPAGMARKRAIRHALYDSQWKDREHLVFSLPKEDEGLGFLVVRRPRRMQDDMWLYMPGYRSVRRVSGSSKKRFAGTTLFYEDVRELTGEQTERWKYDMRSLEPWDGRRCQTVTASPKKGTPSVYGSRKLWIDEERAFPLKIEYYDSMGVLWKILTNTEVRQLRPGVWRARLLEMRDVKRNVTTLILITKRKVGIEIPMHIFTKDNLVHPSS